MISFRTGNIVAILIAVLLFYCRLTGMTPKTLLTGLTTRTTKATQEAGEWVKETLPSPLATREATPATEPSNPSPLSPRLKRHRRPRSRPPEPSRGNP